MKTLIAIVITLALAALIALDLFVVTSCSTQSPEESATPTDVAPASVTLTPEQITALNLTTDSVQLRNLGSALRVHGVVHVPPQYIMSITAPLGGKVVKTTVLPGSPIRKGAPLIVLEDASFVDLQEQYLTVTAELNYAAKELARQRALAPDQVAARRLLEQAERDEQVRRIRQQSLAEQLALIGIDAKTLTPATISRRVTIPAPFNGYVAKVLVNAGSMVDRNGTLLEVIDPSHLHLELSVFERDARLMRVHQPVSVRISGDTSDRPAHVHLIGSTVNADRTVDVHAHLDRPDGALLPGTTLQATIHAGDVPRTAVPSVAIVRRNNVAGVWVASADRTFTFVPVQPGIEEDDWTELLDADSLRTRMVVVQGAHRL